MCNRPEQKFLSKFNFFRLMGRFQKNAKISFLTSLGLVRQYDSPNPYCSPSTIIQGNFLNIQGKDLTGSLRRFSEVLSLISKVFG